MHTSRRYFLGAGSAAALWALTPDLFAQSNFALSKTLCTPEWPELTLAEQTMLNLCLPDDSAKKLMDHKVNQCVYQNSSVQQTLKAYKIGGKPIELKRNWEVDIVLGRFYNGAIKRAHDNNPNDALLKVGEMWSAFLDHCSYHVLKDGIRYLGAAAQGLQLSDAFVFHPKQAALKTSMSFYETLMGKVEDWPVFKHLPFDPVKINIWDENTVEKIASQLPRYDLLAIMKKLGVGTSFLKITAEDLIAVGINKNEPIVRLKYSAAAAPK